MFFLCFVFKYFYSETIFSYKVEKMRAYNL